MSRIDFGRRGSTTYETFVTRNVLYVVDSSFAEILFSTNSQAVLRFPRPRSPPVDTGDGVRAEYDFSRGVRGKHHLKNKSGKIIFRRSV